MVPKTVRARPGYRNSQRGLNSSRKRRCRQPSRQVRRCGGRERPSAAGGRHLGDGQTARARPCTTISLANSMPGFADRGPRWHRGESRAARNGSRRSWTPKEQPADAAEHRIAEITVQERHGAGRDAALEAVAHDQIAAVAQFRHEGLQAGKIVAVVGVAHDDETAPRRRDAGRGVPPVAAFARPPRHARRHAAPTPANRRSSRCRRSTPRPTMPLRSRNATPCATQTAMVSASLRQGIRMVNSTADAVGTTIGRLELWTRPGWRIGSSGLQRSRPPPNAFFVPFATGDESILD